MTNASSDTLQQLFDARYADAPDVAEHAPAHDILTSMARRGSCRDFLDTPVPGDMIDLLCATALASPTKSDLQQRDILVLDTQAQREALAALVPGQSWIAAAPVIAVFCGNNRRQRLLHDWHNVPFANDHLDAFFNAAVDAALALGAFVTAAEAMGLGCCPISAVRNKAQRVSDLLGLPAHVFPVAGLAFGFRAAPPKITPRLPLEVTCHRGQYREGNLREVVTAYNAHRANLHPYEHQRLVDHFGEAPDYGWSDDKVRQYSQSERADFGAYVRSIGFSLD